MRNKVFVCGAGQIGTHMMDYLIHSRAMGYADVLLYSPNNHMRVAGAYEDLLDAEALTGIRSSSWNFCATNKIEEMLGSNIVIFTAGKFPKPEEYAAAKEKGIDDRQVQAVLNFDILDEFCEAVNTFCPKAMVFIVTNPVDLMTEIARRKLPNAEVYGLGCFLDTARFKNLFAREARRCGWKCEATDVHAWILGHHNANMFLHRPSFSVRGNTELTMDERMRDETLMETRIRGGKLTQMSEAAQTPKMNNGAFFAPAVMIAEVVKALLNKDHLELPLNRPIEVEDGVGLEGAAQMPCLITRGRVKPLYLDFTPLDIEDLRYSLNAYEQSKIALVQYIG